MHCPAHFFGTSDQFPEVGFVIEMAGDMTASETPAQKALRKANAQLVRDLVPGDTYNDLFSMGYLSAPQLEEIRGLADQKKHSRANEEIVSAMMKRSDAEIVAFCELLYKKQQRKCGEALLKGKGSGLVSQLATFL